MKAKRTPTTVQYRLTAAERARMARLRLPQPPDSEIDFSDIPEATPEQLRAMQKKRAGKGHGPKRIVAVQNRTVAIHRMTAAERAVFVRHLAAATLRWALEDLDREPERGRAKAVTRKPREGK